MRLLYAKTMKLHTVEENKAPEYAILSHTWDDGEILLEDLGDISQASKKAGFAKIRFCCDQAERDDILYVWIDTCCIDKTSSAELSEAINSMYRWYQNAKVCYAYLRDASKSAYNCDADIRNSRWFRRAWTLQELLAPKEVVFYSDDGNKIGSRASLKTVIADTTGIDVEYLTHRQLHTASVAKRMSWAANRQASRAEDIAYSLFGIFNVHMPLLYGEGQQKAFLRLQEEIMKFSDDHTLFAWGFSTPVVMTHVQTQKYGSLLAQSPADFIDSRDLVPFGGYDSATPYSMTNIALRISLPLEYDLNPTKFSRRISNLLVRGDIPGIIRAPLKCRKANDFFNVLAIPLQHLGSKQFRRCPYYGVSLLPTTNLTRYIEQDIFIRNELTKPLNSDKRRLGLIIRSIAPEIEILEAYPSEFWRPKEMILQGLKGRDDKQSWHACLLLDTKLNGHRGQSILALGVIFPRRAWCYLLDREQGKSLPQFHEELQAPNLGRLSEKGHIQVEFENSPEGMTHKVFGEDMFIVDIKVNEL
jgi:hypothetical protein